MFNLRPNGVRSLYPGGTHRTVTVPDKELLRLSLTAQLKDTERDNLRTTYNLDRAFRNLGDATVRHLKELLMTILRLKTISWPTQHTRDIQ